MGSHCLPVPIFQNPGGSGSGLHSDWLLRVRHHFQMWCWVGYLPDYLHQIHETELVALMSVQRELGCACRTCSCGRIQSPFSSRGFNGSLRPFVHIFAFLSEDWIPLFRARLKRCLFHCSRKVFMPSPF